MSASLELIRKAIETHLNTNWIATEIAWPNKNLDVASLPAWIAPSIFPESAIQDVINSSSTPRGQKETGLYIIQVFVADDSGTQTIAQYTEALCALFNRAVLFSDTGNQIRFLVPRSVAVGSSGSAGSVWFQHNVILEFYYRP